MKTLYQAGKLAQASRILESYKLAFMGISEMRWNECGQLVTPKGHVLLWSGMPSENDTHQYGVGLLVNARWRNAILNYKFVNERIIFVRFKCKARNLSIIQCYAPTEDTDDAVKQEFYDQLNNIIADTPKRDLKVLMGDFNAKVGSNNEDIEHVMGKHGLGEMNNNGELLVELCWLNEFKIGGTLFPHKAEHKVTWVSPDSRTQNQIDHICISAKWSNTLCDVRNKRGADIGSDHHMLMGSLRIKFTKALDTQRCPRVKYKIAKLKSAEQRDAFSRTLREKLTVNDADSNIDRGWQNFKKAVNETCMERLGKAKNTKEDFISQKTWELIDSRAKLKNEINSIKLINERKAAQIRYNQLDKRVRREVRDDKKEFINSLASKAESAAATHNMKQLYDITKRIAGKANKRTVPVKSKDGEILTNVTEQLSRWKEHFSEVLNLNRDGVSVTNESSNSNTLPIKTTPPSKREIIDAINSMKSGKAAGIDNITAEVLQVDVNFVADQFRTLFLHIWENESFPQDWLQGIIIKLPKKGDLTDCNNWRGINILCVALKVFMKIILERMVNVIDKKIRPNQAGFRPGRSCIDQINTIRIIIEQSVELNSPLYLLFIDYEKAFDSVDRECIWMELKNIGVPEKIVSVIRSSYSNFRCRVLHDGKMSEPFDTLTGVRQGCLLSPLLFLIVLDAVARRATRDKPRGIVWNPVKPDERLESLDFADDKLELSHTYRDMTLKKNDLAAESAKVGLKINVKKTKEMRVNAESNQPFTLYGEEVERVEKFQYLGSIISEDGGAAKDVLSRINKARGAYTQLCKIWRSTTYSVKTKIHIFKTCVLSVLLYGCETWLVTEAIKNKIQVFVNRCLRRILRIFWPNTISNEELWRKAELRDINMEIRRRKFGWIGHTLRRVPDEICNRALVYNPQGQRRRGRPKNTWRRSTLDEINSTVQPGANRYNDIWGLKELAARRTRWKNFVDGLCSV